MSVESQQMCMRDSHHNLEAIEAARLGCLHFIAETLDEVLVDNAIGRREESENVADEVSLIVIQLVLPVMHILRQIHLFGSPEGRLGLLVHLPDLQTSLSDELLTIPRVTYFMVLNREEDETTLRLDQERLLVCRTG